MKPSLVTADDMDCHHINQTQYDPKNFMYKASIFKPIKTSRKYYLFGIYTTLDKMSEKTWRIKAVIFSAVWSRHAALYFLILTAFCKV